MDTHPDDTSAKREEFADAWKAINAYAKLVAIQTACLQAGFEIDRAEIQQARASKIAVNKELTKLCESLKEGA